MGLEEVGLEVGDNVKATGICGELVGDNVETTGVVPGIGGSPAIAKCSNNRPRKCFIEKSIKQNTTHRRMRSYEGGVKKSIFLSLELLGGFTVRTWNPWAAL